jgi:purine-binding chemotaxis protein CheW
MEITNEKGATIEDVKKEAALDIQKKNLGVRIQLIIFKLGTEEYALSIDQIKEVVLTPRIAKMPQTPSYIRGVANIRGNIIAILDLREKFGIDPSEENDVQHFNYTLVIENEIFKAGFLVAEVPNTLTIQASDVETSANFIQSSSVDENCIQGIVKIGERLIILIDMIKLMESINVNNVVNKAIK